MGDVIIAVILTFTTVRGAFRGFTKSIFEIIAIVLALLISYSFKDNLIEYLISLGLPFEHSIIQSVILMFMVAIIICIITTVGNFLGKNIIPISFLWVDKMGGIIAGLGLGFLFVGGLIFYAQLFGYEEVSIISQISQTANAYFQGINDSVISLFGFITHNNNG